jgi:hypothetical protein
MFPCGHCAAPLVVDRNAAGMTLNCQRCHKPIEVPRLPEVKASSSADAGGINDPALQAANEQLADVQRRLKENESQRTEITGYINQLSIQLHRWQLRLQTLNERQKQLHAEMQAAGASVP